MNTQKRSIQNLEISLGHLAAKWRGSYNDPELQDTIVQQYHATIRQLYELGWDDVVDIESELPERIMPKEYLERNPSFYSSNVSSMGMKKKPKQ